MVAPCTADSGRSYIGLASGAWQSGCGRRRSWRRHRQRRSQRRRGQQKLPDGDVILDVAGKPEAQPSGAKAAIANAKRDGKKAVLTRIKTAQGERFVAFEFPKA